MSSPERNPVHAYFETSTYLDRNAVIPVRARIVRDWLSTTANSHVLDLGCGDGSISLPLLGAGNSLTLVDFSDRMLALAQSAAPSSADVTFVRADILDYAPRV